MKTTCCLRNTHWIITHFKDCSKIQRLRQQPDSKTLSLFKYLFQKLDLPINQRTMGRPGIGWEMLYATRHTSIVTVQGPLAVFTVGAVHALTTPPPPPRNLIPINWIAGIIALVATFGTAVFQHITHRTRGAKAPRSDPAAWHKPITATNTMFQSTNIWMTCFVKWSISSSVCSLITLYWPTSTFRRHK